MSEPDILAGLPPRKGSGMEVTDHHQSVEATSRQYEMHVKARFRRYWEAKCLLEAKLHTDPTQAFYFLRMRFRKRLAELKRAGIQNNTIQRYGLDNPLRSDIDFNLELANAVKRREIQLQREERKRARSAQANHCTTGTAGPGGG